MATIFAETIARAISDYRQMLRRYLNQSERVTKLAELNLRDTHIYESEVSLYNTARAIIADIEKNMQVSEQGYYSYSGIAKFSEYLKEYVDNYEIENDKVIHRAQKASKALIQAIQIATLPNEKLDEKVALDFEKCNELIVECGSPEQQELHFHNLERRRDHHAEFYGPLLDHYNQLLAGEPEASETVEAKTAEEEDDTGGGGINTDFLGEHNLVQDVA